MYKRQVFDIATFDALTGLLDRIEGEFLSKHQFDVAENIFCLLYTSDAADERSSVDLGGRRIIKKKNIAKRVGASPHIRTINTILE